MDVHDAVFDPATGVLTIDATSGPRGAIAVDGKPLEGFAPGKRFKKEVKAR